MPEIRKKYILFFSLIFVLALGWFICSGINLKAEAPQNRNELKALSLKLDEVLIQLKKLSSLKSIESKLDIIIKNQDGLKKEIESLKKRVSSRI